LKLKVISKNIVFSLHDFTCKITFSIVFNIVVLVKRDAIILLNLLDMYDIEDSHRR